MNSIRIAIAAAALSVTSIAFAGDVNAAQTFGRDTVSQGVVRVSGDVAAQGVNAVSGRQGGLSDAAKLDASGKAHSTVNVVERGGRA